MGLEEGVQQSHSLHGLSSHHSPLPLAVHEIQESQAKIDMLESNDLFLEWKEQVLRY